MIDPDALIHITDENDTEVLVSGKVVPVNDMIAVDGYRKMKSEEIAVNGHFRGNYDDEVYYGGYNSRGNGIIVPASIVAEIEHRE